eukprot:scaffold7451_cov185-Amphora_coffeaeformis.AAC.3
MMFQDGTTDVSNNHQTSISLTESSSAASPRSVQSVFENVPLSCRGDVDVDDEDDDSFDPHKLKRTHKHFSSDSSITETTTELIEEDESSSCYLEAWSVLSIQEIPIKRRVRFSVQVEDYPEYKSPWVLTSDAYSYTRPDPDDHGDDDVDDCIESRITVFIQDVWYQSSELHDFKHHVQTLARFVARREQETRAKHTGTIITWSSCLYKAYKKCHQINNVDDCRKLVASAAVCPVHPTVVGLDKWALPTIYPKRMYTRRILQDTVLWYQANSLTRNPTALRKECREITRPNRLFAFYIGCLGQNEETDELEILSADEI